MAKPLIAPLAPGIALHPGYEMKLIAVDATTGNAVSGVVVSNVSMQVLAADPEEQPEPISIIPPALTYSPSRA